MLYSGCPLQATYLVNCAGIILVWFLDCTTNWAVVWGYGTYSINAKQMQFIRVPLLSAKGCHSSVACNYMYCVSWLHMTVPCSAAQGCIGVCRWWICWYFRFCSWSWLELVHGLLHLHTRRSSSIWDTSEYHHCCELTLVFSAHLYCTMIKTTWWPFQLLVFSFVCLWNSFWRWVSGVG